MENYFAYYELKPRFFIDEHKLRAEYLRLSKENHPDFFVNDEENHARALEQTSLNNQAYHVLKNFDSRVKHILQEEGLLKDSGSEVPQSFLMEMMDLNEEIMELQMDFDSERYEKVLSQFETQEEEIRKNIEELAWKCDERWNEGEDAKEELKAILDQYLKQKYLLRIKETLSKFAAS